MTSGSFSIAYAILQIYNGIGIRNMYFSSYTDESKFDAYLLFLAFEVRVNFPIIK